MVELGYETTLPVTVDEMLHHARAVSRGARRPLLVVDLPFGSFESSFSAAFSSASRFLKESNMDAVKIEGGKERAFLVKQLVSAGVSVMGHVGLTPQRISVLGGFRAQGKTLASASALLEDALEIERAGAFALVIECVPPLVAKAISSAVKIPTLGIGAGPHCDGQVLVFHDLLGFFQHAHHAQVTPSFCKTYARVGEEIQRGLEAYRADVFTRQFPSSQYSPYKIKASQESELTARLEEQAEKIKNRFKKRDEREERQSEPGTELSHDTDDEPIKVY